MRIYERKMRKVQKFFMRKVWNLRIFRLKKCELAKLNGKP